MRVWTKAEFDIETMRLVSGECCEYDGPVAECKGADKADQQRTDDLNMQKQAFAAQTAQLDQLKTQLSPYLSSQGQGYTPEQNAAMQSQFLNQNASQFQNAGQQVRQALLARGSGAGDTPVGGDYTRGISSLMGAAGASQAQGLLGLQQQNALQALSNKFNAAGILSGNAQTLGQTQSTAGSGASNALSSYIQAKNTGIMQSLASGFGQGLGGGLGSMATGGLSNWISGIGKSAGSGGGGGPDITGMGVCWVAAELYGGWNAPCTEIVRQWMYAHPIVLAVYKRIGKPLAAFISRNKLARRIVKSLFDRIVEA